jgi:membrane-bound lytic murein transglycosylase F
MGGRRHIGLLLLIVLLMSCSNDNAAGSRPPEEELSVNPEILNDSIRYARVFDLNKKRALSKMVIRYKPIIKKYAKRYGFDWRLIVAQIVQESGFKEKAKSRAGARGLMQLMPGTAKEIGRELEFEYIMKRPRENITAGIYHLYKQTRFFPEAEKDERLKLSLASYNCGAGHVFDAQRIAEYYRRPENYWDEVSPFLAKLKKDDWQLHLQVWPTGKPQYGYFYGYEETTNYVNNIWGMYLAYKKIL